MKQKIGFIGCGNMGAGLLEGILKNRLVAKRQVFVYEVDVARRKKLKARCGIQTVDSLETLSKKVSILLVAIKPQQLEAVAKKLKATLTRRHTVVSILAGITLGNLKKVLGPEAGIVRVMPNLGAIVGEAASALCGTSPRAVRLAKPLFAACGEVVEVKERLMNSVTAISGSGPAYFFYLMELLEEEGKKAGLPRAVARKLSVQTALGAGCLAKEGSHSPEELRKMVTSKKGTTEAALKTFKKNGFGRIVSAAVKKATQRAKELSR